MKKSLLFASAFVALCSLGNAQTSVKWADFESFTPFLEGFGASTYDVVDNPSKTGVNTSAKVAHTNHGDQTWAGLWGPAGGTVNFSATDHTFKMKVYSAIAGDILFKFEQFDTATVNTGDLIAKYTTPGVWQELTFDFPATLKAGVYSKIVLFPGNGLTTRDDWYFDDIEGVDYTPSAKYNVIVVVNNKTAKTPVFKAKLGTTEITLNDAGTDGDATAADGKFSGTIKDVAGTNFKSTTGKYEVSILVDGVENSKEPLNVWGTNLNVPLNVVYAGAPLVDDKGVMSAAKTATAPTIDGVVDDIWKNQPVHNQLNRIFKSTLELNASFKMMWDDKNVYVLQTIEDLTPKGIGNAAGTEWNFDCSEMFFDMDLSGKATGADGKYDGINDWQIRYNRGFEPNSVTGSAAVSSADGFLHAQKENTDGKGYIMEWQIPFTALDAGFTAENNAKFGFCLNTSDNTGSARTDGESWSATVDDAYQNTRSFGVVTLTEGTGTGVKQAAADLFGIYPNPVSSVLSISKSANVASVVISDLSGRKVISLSKSEISNGINVASIANGLYIITLTDLQGNTFSSKFVKK